MNIEQQETITYDEAWAQVEIARLRRAQETIDRIAAARRLHIEIATQEAADFEQVDYNAAVRTVENLTRELKAWALDRRSRTRIASFLTPSGSIQTTGGAKWNWHNEDAVVEHLAKASPDLVRVETSIRKDLLKKSAIVKDGVVVLDGEPVPGVLVDETAVTVTVTVTS
jgi:hypothetical protein